MSDTSCGMGFISRGFKGRRRDTASSSRLPPGQYLVNDWPVLSAGPTPRVALDQWSFTIEGEIDQPRKWTWKEFTALPSEVLTKDIHCVTKWSKFDVEFKGVSLDTLLEGVETAAEHTTQVSYGGYTTNLPLDDLQATRHGSSTRPTPSRWRRSTAVPRACSCLTSTSGRARNGSAPCVSTKRRSPASGRRTATTTTVTPGVSSGTGATEGPAKSAASPAIPRAPLKWQLGT